MWREPVRAHLGLALRANRWFVAAWLLPLALSLLALTIACGIPGVRYDGTLQPAVDRAILSATRLDALRRTARSMSVPPLLLLVPSSMIASLTISFVAGAGEEIGWRGLLHTELRPFGMWRCAMITGAFWTVWHLPLIAFGYGFPQHPARGALLMAGYLLPWSIAAVIFRERTGSSLAVGLFHGSENAFGVLAVAPVSGGSDLSVGSASSSAIAALSILVLGLLIHDRWLADRPLPWTRPNSGRAAR